MVRLQDHLPVDHRLGQIYRWGSIGSAVVLLAFGVLGLLDDIPFFSTQGERVMGMSSNGLLSVASILVGGFLLVAARIGGNFASTANMVMGIVFIVAGLLGLAVMDTGANFLAFGLPNVFFSFAVGLIMMTFGMYGRVNLYLPYDNPYYQARHPEEPQRRGGAATALDAGGRPVAALRPRGLSSGLSSGVSSAQTRRPTSS